MFCVINEILYTIPKSNVQNERKKTEAAAREEERMAMLERTMKAVCVCVCGFVYFCDCNLFVLQ